jgi:hypothetical protein
MERGKMKALKFYKEVKKVWENSQRQARKGKFDLDTFVCEVEEVMREFFGTQERESESE